MLLHLAQLTSFKRYGNTAIVRTKLSRAFVGKEFKKSVSIAPTVFFMLLYQFFSLPSTMDANLSTIFP